MRILNWIHFAVISFVFSQRRTTTGGDTLAPQPKSPIIDTSTTTSTTDIITTSTITSTITTSSTTITGSSTTFTVSETVTPVAQESSYDLVWIIGAIVAVCLLLSVTFAFFLYCCKSPQNPIQYSMSMDRRYQSNYDYKPPKLFAEYTLPTKQQESYSRPIAAHMNSYSRPPTHSNQFRQPVMNTVPVQMDDGYYYYDVNGNPTEPYYFDDYNNVVFVDQNGYAVRTVPNPQIQQPGAVTYDNNINQHPQGFTQPTIPPPIEKDEFYKNDNRTSSLFASSSVNNTIKKNDEIMEWFDPAKVTEDEKVETNKDIMEWFKTPLEPLESKFPSSGGSNSDKVVDSPAVLGSKNTNASGEIDVAPKLAEEFGVKKHESELVNLETLSRQLLVEYGLNMDELGHSRASDRKDSGNIPVSYPPVPIEAHTPTNTDEIEPEVDEDSVFTVGPADRDNHNSLDIPLEAVQVSGESIENYKDDISSDVLETVTQTQVASEGENVGNRRELESEKASKLDSMEEPANPNEDNGVESIKEDNNIESINTSKTDKEEFSEEKEYQISKEIQLSKSSQH